MVIGLAWFFISPSSASAASHIRFVSLGDSPADASRSFEVEVVVDSDELLNAYALGISFDTASVSLESVNTAGSLITIWQTQPKIDTGGSIKFNGASIKPFSGTDGMLLRMRFRAKEGASSTMLTFLRNTAVYLANGKGTRIVPETQSMTMELDKIEGNASASGTEDVDASNLDKNAPIITFASLGVDPVNLDQKLFAFLATDDKSGIRLVETRSRSWFAWSGWQTAQNPMAYGKNIWTVELRITDNAGNTVTKTIYDLKALANRAVTAVLGIFVLAAWLL